MICRKHFTRPTALIICLVLILGLFFAAPAHAADAYSVRVDGKLLSLDVSPAMVNSRLMVPFRPIFEALGVTRMSYDESTRTVYASGADVSISLRVGTTQAYVNGRARTLDAAPFIANGRVLVPLRFVSESLGATADYDAPSRTALINSPGYTKPADPVGASKESDLLLFNVYIEAGTRTSSWTGTGVVIHSSGIILTNRHVVEGSLTFLHSYIGDQLYTGYELFTVNRARDYAIYKITLGRNDPPLSAPIFGDSSSVAVGDSVYTCGNPEGVRDQTARGTVLSISNSDPNSPGSYITSARARPGSSGSGLYDSNFRLIGVVWGHDIYDNSLAVPLHYIIRQIREAIDYYAAAKAA